MRDDDAARRARRLDRGLDDQPHQLVDVVCRAERLAEAGDDVAQAAALALELVEPRLQLRPPSR